MPTRRAAILAAALTVLAAAGCSGSGSAEKQADQNTLVVSTFPFGVKEFEQAVVAPFTKQTGIKVELDTGSNSDRLSKLRLAKGKPEADVVLISDYFAALGQKDGLFQKVDVPNIKQLAPFATEGTFEGPAYTHQLNGIIYNTGKLSQKQAADWALFASPANKGKVALPDISVTAGQLMISGVGESYGKGPYDIDTSLKTLSGWAPNVLQFYTSSTEVTNLLTQGEIVAADALSGFATKLVTSGEPIAWTAPAKGRYMATNRAMIPKGARNQQGAAKFIDYMLSAEAQSAMAKAAGDLPTNPKAEIPAEVAKVTGEAAKDPVAAGFKTLDPAQLVDTRTTWVDRFTREVAGK
ncbi:polyamine ABC transporter substrate-binding protein [Nonomuraea sp. NPDC050680]|uniref:ABC transporter substrate-binding protein n=1 Tax=Nonomuraea sp. NPDC050680 TaxID=3154630 RepID=UPI00340E38D6